MKLYAHCLESYVRQMLRYFSRVKIFSHSVYVLVFNLRSCHLRLTVSRALYAYKYRSGHPVQYLDNVSHGQKLSLTSGQLEFEALAHVIL
jgi:hypothetical protein